MDSQDSLLNIQQLNTFIDLGLADFTDILGDVITDLPNHLDKIETAVRNGDERLARSTAHSTRGMVATFGCVAMTRALHQVEHGPSIPPQDAAVLRSYFDALWARTLAAIQTWQQSAPFTE